MQDLFEPTSHTKHIALPVNDAQILDWVRLTRSENVGPVTFFKLLERFGTPAKALQAIPDMAKRGGSRRPIKVCPVDEAMQEIQTAYNNNVSFIPYSSSDYPELLQHVHDPPPFLWARGQTSFLNKKCIAIVGSRNASAAGVRFAAHLGRELSRSHQYCITSGLARGIDAAVHTSALDTTGMTASVVAGGVDVVWPPETKGIAEKIWQDGVSVSEMPMGQQPRNRHFPRRNRIISGMSRGVILVEAAQKSGSLITAQYALDQGRDVLAVPGSPLDARAAGCNDLIRKGATLVRSVDDILEALAHWEDLHIIQGMAATPHSFEHITCDQKDIDNARATVVNLLSPTPTLIDDIITQSCCSVPVVQSVLLELDLAGQLERHYGGYVSLCNI